jgi:hypothetical protein
MLTIESNGLGNRLSLAPAAAPRRSLLLPVRRLSPSGSNPNTSAPTLWSSPHRVAARFSAYRLPRSVCELALP